MSHARTMSLLVALVATGCHSSPKEPTGASSITAASPATSTSPMVASGPPAGRAERMPRCPNVIPGATTVVSEIPDGVELRITAAGSGATEIRRRAALLVSAADATRGKHRANGGGNAQFGRCPIVMRNTKVEAQDIEGGSVVVLTPWDADELGWLRREVEARTAQLATPKTFGRGLLRSCPNAVPNSETRVEDKPYGVDVKITAETADGAASIRERASQIGSLGPAAEQRCPVTTPLAVPVAGELKNGAVIALKARRPEDIPALRRDVYERVRSFDAPTIPKGKE